MEEITEHNLINLIKEKFPKFLTYWQAYINKCRFDRGPGDDMEPLVDYVVDEIKSENYHEIEIFFNFIEFLICNGDELVQAVIENCFLVSLLYKDPDEIQFIKFSQYLGKETMSFLRIWNQYNDSQTKGLE